MHGISSNSRYNREVKRPRVLVLGIYLANKPTHVRGIVAALSKPSHYEIDQRWIGIRGVIEDPLVKEVTCSYKMTAIPKFVLINELLEREEVNTYEYVIIIDDDITLPEKFVDSFLWAQSALGFSLAQPARTRNSFIDHSITRQNDRMLARETLFVEIGPVTCFHRSIFHLVFPFDTTSPMGWGYENVWAYRLSRNGFKMGIIDAYPVDHSLRPPAAYYNLKNAKDAQRRLLSSQPHAPLRRYYNTLRSVPLLSRTERTQAQWHERTRGLWTCVRELWVEMSLLLGKLALRTKRAFAANQEM